MAVSSHEEDGSCYGCFVRACRFRLWGKGNRCSHNNNQADDNDYHDDNNNYDHHHDHHHDHDAYDDLASAADSASGLPCHRGRDKPSADCHLRQLLRGRNRTLGEKPCFLRRDGEPPAAVRTIAGQHCLASPVSGPSYRRHKIEFACDPALLQLFSPAGNGRIPITV